MKKGLGSMISAMLSITLVVLIIIGILKWADLMVGTPMDWVVGVAGFWWLSIVVTLPWDVYFKTKEILVNSSKTGDKASNKDKRYAKKLGTYAITTAIVLHILSSAVFYLLSYYEITSIGYIASIVALLLTLLRPLIRAYEYLNRQLMRIERSVNYPKDNVYELKNKVESQEKLITELKNKLDLENEFSWAAELEKKIENNDRRVEDLLVKLSQLKDENVIEHNRISKESKDAMAQLTIDGEFLNHVREVIRFFKKA